MLIEPRTFIAACPSGLQCILQLPTLLAFLLAGIQQFHESPQVYTTSLLLLPLCWLHTRKLPKQNNPPIYGYVLLVQRQQLKQKVPCRQLMLCHVFLPSHSFHCRWWLVLRFPLIRPTALYPSRCYHPFSGVAMPTKPQTKDSASKYFFSSRLGNYVGEMLIQPKPNPLPLISSASSILIEIHWHRILGAYHAHHAFFFARPLLSITFKPGRKKGQQFLILPLILLYIRNTSYAAVVLYVV